MNRYVVDTHALFWYLTSSKRLGPQAKQALDDATSGQALVLLPSIVLAELHFLNEKQGRPVDFAQVFERIQNHPQFEFVAFIAGDVLEFGIDSGIPEMHDRIVAGVARRYDVPCLTRDVAMMQAGNITTLW